MLMVTNIYKVTNIYIVIDKRSKKDYNLTYKRSKYIDKKLFYKLYLVINFKYI